MLVADGQPEPGADGLGEGSVRDVPLLLLALAFLDDLLECDGNKKKRTIC